MRQRLLLYMSSVALGVGALVAIDSFTANVARSVHASSRSLLGGDLALTARAPLQGAAAAVVDSLTRAGARSAGVTTFASMATVRRTGRTRLAQVRAVSTGYPLVGTVTTDPADAWTGLQSGASAIVDPSLLATLDGRVGDSLALGYGQFEIVGTIRAVPGDAGIAAAIGPRVFIRDDLLPATRLLVFGSRADYKTLVALTPGGARVVPERWLSRARRRLEPDHVRLQTAADAEVNLTNAIHRLSEFLGVVGVVALLLGGIGVASGVTAFVARKIDAAAILRCLGATGPQVLVLYTAQAAMMGLVGAAIGAALGIAIQQALPIALRDFIPVDISVELVPRAIAIGLGVGVWIALLFASRPLLALRGISPLQALRRDADAYHARPGPRDPAVVAVTALIALSVMGMAIARAPSVRVGLGTSLGIGAAFAALWLAASLLAAGARRLVRPRWPYVLRQGVANLYRPGNQTRAVILALGFGGFLISTLYLVQSALLREFATATRASGANLLFFDVQEDQAPGLDSIIRAAGYPVIQRTPIVTMRIAAINDAPVSAAARADSAESADAEATARPASGRTAARGERGRPRRAGWALRREYRSTYRDTLIASERVVAGRWPVRGAAGDSVPGVSFEDGVAKELGLLVGDHVTWNVQGVPIRTRVASLREVDWARFEPNFFAVFPAGVLERAPKQFVVVTSVAGSEATAGLQRVVVDRYPNVSSIDLTLVRETVNGIVRKVTVAIRFLAVFSFAMGIPVLFSAVAATRRDRVREGVLLKTLGATRAQVGRIMVTEYAVLGVLGGLAGTVLSVGGAWALMHYVFEAPLAFAPLPALAIAGVIAGLTVSIGLVGGWDVFADTPLAMLRAE